MDIKIFLFFPPNYLKKLFYVIGVQLLYNIVLVSAVEQHGSAPYIHISPP